ncbi:MAG: class I SAM-dependent methyltransferase [Pseudomonadota bacterium]
MHTYGQDAATHYAAYRPPLHRPILARALVHQNFKRALDFGCGTGQSSLALVSFADEIIGVDKSAEMLAAATKYPVIEYRLGAEDELPVQGCSIDLVTMAGVLPYLEIGAFLSELRRACTPKATLIVYDFKLRLMPLLTLFPKVSTFKSSKYEHSKNLDGQSGISTIEQCRDVIEFDIQSGQAAHLILANEARLKKLESLPNPEADVFAFVERSLQANGFSGKLEAEIYWAVHRFVE